MQENDVIQILPECKEDFLTLGIDISRRNSITYGEVKGVGRTKRLEHHPDKGGDTAMFQKVETAFANIKRTASLSPPTVIESDNEEVSEAFLAMCKQAKHRQASKKMRRDTHEGVNPPKATSESEANKEDAKAGHNNQLGLVVSGVSLALMLALTKPAAQKGFAINLWFFSCVGFNATLYAAYKKLDLFFGDRETKPSAPYGGDYSKRSASI